MVCTKQIAIKLLGRGVGGRELEAGGSAKKGGRRVTTHSQEWQLEWAAKMAVLPILVLWDDDKC